MKYGKVVEECVGLPFALATVCKHSKIKFHIKGGMLVKSIIWYKYLRLHCFLAVNILLNQPILDQQLDAILS